jgi:type I site-specific restriction endonuclease
MVDNYVITEADTCRKYVLPKLYAAGWNDDQISEQKSFTDGRILVVGAKARRRPAKRADYLLRYARDFMLAVVEAKAAYKLPGDGLQQAKDYAAILGLKFAYSTNGRGIVEFDFTTGKERQLDTFPKPAELWERFRASEKIDDEEIASRILTPANAAIGKGRATIKKSPSTESCKRCFKARSESFSPWPRALARRPWLFRSAGSSGTCAGTAPASTGVRRFSIWRTGTF